nr:hypothetical protein GCM10020093_035460 [Planobispora longispora]
MGVAAHTTNDSIVWIPERRVLFSGDLVFNGGTPFVLMGSVPGALRVLDDLEALGPQTIVPGHGGVCGPGAIDRVRGYLRFVLDTAERGRKAGLSPLETARETDLGSTASWATPSASSATCTGPTPTSTACPRARRSTCRPRSWR